MDTLSLTKEARIYNGEKTISNKWCWENCTAKCKRIKLEHSPTLYTEIKWILLFYLNVRPYIIKLLEENIGKALFDVNCSTVFCFFLLIYLILPDI